MSAVALLASSLLALPAGAEGTWASDTPLAFARADHDAVAVNGRIYVIGGVNGHGSRAELEIYDPATASWTRGANMPQGRYHIAVASIGDIVYVVGGASSAGPALDMLAYDTVTETWTTGLAHPAPGLRLEGSALVALDGVLYLIGGRRGGSVSSSVQRYAPATGTWTSVSSMGQARWMHAAAAVLDGRLYVAGGLSANSTSSRVASAEVYDAAADAWQPIAPLPTALVRQASAAWAGRVWMVGGERDPTATCSGGSRDGLHCFYDAECDGGMCVTLQLESAAAYAYDPDTDAWTQAAGELPTPRSALAVATLGPSLFAIGGEHPDENRTARVERFTLPPRIDSVDVTLAPPAVCPTGGTWRRYGSDWNHDGALDALEVVHEEAHCTAAPAGWLPAVPLAGARELHGAVYADGRLFVLGGRAGGATLASVAIHDLEADAWSAGAPLPEPRFAFGAAALAGRIYVVGGRSDDGRASDMLVYDIASAAWLDPVAGPAVARDHPAVAVLDGRLYVAGGRSDDGTEGSVESFDPTTGEWTAGPSLTTARWAHGAAVVSDRLYVVGGRVDDGADPDATGTASVEVFDVSAGAWTSAASLPVATWGHAVDVVDERLFCLGGRTADGASGEVLAYHPALDGWASHPPLPAARESLAAASDGVRLFAVGGNSAADVNATLLYAYAPPALRELADVVPASGEACPSGGVVVLRGLDLDDDGALSDDEVVTREPLCARGESLVEVREEPVGDNCEHGGTRVDTGVDDNGDGVLQADEVERSTYVCDDGPRPDNESCTTTANGDGTATVSCPDGSETIVGTKPGDEHAVPDGGGCTSTRPSGVGLAGLALLLLVWRRRVSRV